MSDQQQVPPPCPGCAGPTTWSFYVQDDLVARAALCPVCDRMHIGLRKPGGAGAAPEAPVVQPGGESCLVACCHCVGAPKPEPGEPAPPCRKCAGPTTWRDYECAKARLRLPHCKACLGAYNTGYEGLAADSVPFFCDTPYGYGIYLPPPPPDNAEADRAPEAA